MAAIAERLTSRRNRGTLAAALAVTAFVVFFVAEFWNAGQTVDTDKFIRFIVVGIVLSSIYAIAATGLVVTYTTSGIFNFAQTAMGMFFAFVYWQMKAGTDVDGWGIPTVPSLIIVVFVIAPLTGAVIERVVMRGLANAPLVAQMAATIGLLAFFIGLVDILWSGDKYRTLGTFFGDSKTSTGDLFGLGFGIGDTFVPYYRIMTIVTGIGIAILLRYILYRTRLGIAMRAVVDNRELAGLNGARPGRVSMFAWALSSSMAAVAGIFLAQEFGFLDRNALTLFIVAAFAAAIIGRLRSLPLTLVGGAVIGFSVAFSTEFLNFAQGNLIEVNPLRWQTMTNPGVIPGIILFLALLFVPQARIEGRRAAKAVTARVPSLKRAAVGFAVLFAVMVFLAGPAPSLGLITGPDVLRIEFAVAIAFVMLSLVPLTGWSGQISFAQVTFAGVGTWAGFEFSSSGGNAFGLHLYPPGSPLSLVLAAAIAVPIGLLMALPALRLQGLYLALSTMAFALIAIVVFTFPEVYSTTGHKIEAISLFGQELDQPFTLLGIDFPESAGFLMFATFLFCVVGFGVVALRRGRFGRRLVAIRDSPAACATLGVNLLTTKLAVFGLSAAIAGLAGAVVGVHFGNVQTTNFDLLQGLDGAGFATLLLVVVGGIAVVSGAVFGATLLVVFTKFLPIVWFPGVEPVQWWSKIGSGLAGIGISRQPEGVIPQVGHDLRERKRAKEARATPSPPAAPAAATSETPTVAAAPPAPAKTT